MTKEDKFRVVAKLHTKDMDSILVDEYKSSVEKQKEYLRQVCPDFASYEESVLQVSGQFIWTYQTFLTQMDTLHNAIDESHLKAHYYCKKHNINNDKKRTIDEYYQKITEALVSGKVQLEEFIGNVEHERSHINYFAGELYKLMSNSQNAEADSLEASEISEEIDANIDKMREDEECLMWNIENCDPLLRLRMQSTNNVVHDFIKMVDDFVGEGETSERTGKDR